MNPEDPTANPQPPAPTERLTGQMRWLREARGSVYVTDTLQGDLVRIVHTLRQLVCVKG